MSALFSVGGKFLNIGEPLTFGPGNPSPLALTMRGNSYLPCVNQTSQDILVPCWAIFTGGVGPYTFSLPNGQANEPKFGYYEQACSSGNGDFVLNTTTGVITYNPGTQTTSDEDTIVLAVTDAQGSTTTASFTVKYTTNPIYFLGYAPGIDTGQPISGDYFLTNWPVSVLYVGAPIYTALSLFAANFSNTASDFTFSDPSNTFTFSGGGTNPVGSIFIDTNDYGGNSYDWPANIPSSYPITLTASNPTGTGSPEFKIIIDVYIYKNSGPNQIFFTQTIPSISTSLPVGFIVGQVTCSGDLDNIYVWTMLSSEYFAVSQTGQISVAVTIPSAGTKTFTVQVSD